ncbi:CehA/McbA family metallohydrolase [Fredinandcohnia sp. 179-A 10B2 NHS]|uniref:CehA/McbA family metallohydrolase n=1 Tax=Fredinandcohnia sp. 179-A 10B2 NHS TaxID=3235176 RepID=UPI0039A2F75D
MKNWYPFELHTHTPHSDGTHTLLEMARKAKELGLQGIALTDHNTMSGLVDREAVMEETGVYVARGLEWTTFYGHMVALGIKDYADWRDLSPVEIHKGIERIHQQGGLAGIVHPYRIGSPICTGCFWEYQITDWTEVDYIEVWSETFPSIKKSNRRAFDLWLDRLNKGNEISGVSGRDWHRSSNNEQPVAATFLQIDQGKEISDDTILDAIKSGRISVSMGPLLLMDIVDREGKSYSIGDRVAIDTLELPNIKVEVDFEVRNGSWKLEDQTLQVIINSNKGMEKKLQISKENPKVETPLNLDGVKYFYAELHGIFEGVKTMIGFTNPIYVR